MDHPRRDLLEGLLQACWLIESARARVYGSWGFEYEEHTERTALRVEILGDAMAGQDVPRPVDVVDAHNEWARSMVGPSIEEVPLGPRVMRRYGRWTDAFVGPLLGSRREELVALGDLPLVPAPDPRAVDASELPCGPLPDGRRFVVLNDVHIGARGAERVALRAVEEINALEPDFVVVAGDLTDDGEPDQFTLAASVLRGLGCPWHVVLGNHDAVRRSTRTGDGHALFEHAFGFAPQDRVLECGGLQVALVDTSDPTPWPFVDFDLGSGAFRDDAGGTASGALRPGQADALAAALDPSRPALLVQHHELQPFAAFPPVQFALRRTDSDALLRTVAGHQVVGVVAGHTHRSALTDVGVPQLEVPALKDWPHTYTVVGVQDGRPRAVVRQVDDEEVLSRSAGRITQISRNYTLGPATTLDHTF